MIAPMLRPAALVLVGMLLTACAGPATGPDPAAAGVERLTDGRPAPTLAWHACPDAPEPGVECAELAVPRDHRDPASPPLTLAVTRLRATDPGARRGVLLTNPGGPGAEARWNSLGVDALTGHALRRTYDLVGLDPRGVGASTPARCGLSGRLLSLATSDPTALDFDADLAVARDVAASCARAGADLWPFLSTANAVRDMDLLRAALGEARLSFYGTSYGTSLGTAFASVFPDRTDRVVLDSQDDDTVGWQERFRSSDAAVDARFADVAARIAADPRHGLGTADEVRARYLDLRARAARGEPTLAGTPVEVRGLRVVVEDALRQDGAYVDDLAALLAFFGGTPGAPAENDLAARLGTTSGALDPAAEARLDQVVAAGLGTMCGDPSWSRDPEDYRRAFEEDRAAFPVSAGARATIRPCAFWSTTPRDPLPTLTGAGHTGPPQALILQHRADPATPLAGARRVRDALGPRAVMITTDDGGHGVLGRNPCATDAAVAWLVDGRLPASDTTC